MTDDEIRDTFDSTNITLKQLVAKSGKSKKHILKVLMSPQEVSVVDHNKEVVQHNKRYNKHFSRSNN